VGQLRAAVQLRIGSQIYRRERKDHIKEISFGSFGLLYWRVFAVCANFLAVLVLWVQAANPIIAPRRQECQVTGQGPSSRAEARDLGKISPFGRNDNALPFARVTPTWLRLRRAFFAVNRFCLSLVLLRTLDDLVHFEDVGAGKDLGAGPVAVRFLKLRALRPGVE